MKRTGIWLVLIALSWACSDEGTAPDPSAPARIDIVSGQGQTGLGGETLWTPILVRVVDAEGRGVPRRWVDFETGTGAGLADPAAVATDAAGYAATRWQLGPAATRTQRLHAVLEHDRSLEAQIEAVALGPEDADVVIVRGAQGPLRGLLLVQLGENLDVLYQKAVADTVVQLPPIPGDQIDVLVFSSANRPLLRTTRWTAGVDTVEVTLLPPVVIDFTYTIRGAELDEQIEAIEHHREAMREIWQSAGAGIVEGDVSYVDATDSEAPFDVITAGLCDRTLASPSMQVTYSTTVGSSPYRGHGCLTGNVFMGSLTSAYPNLLAHELGHTFSLMHTGGVMNPSNPGTYLSDGQIFRAHFDERSALNTIFQSQPEAQRRFCSDRPRDSICLPEDFDLPPVDPSASRGGS